MTKKFKNAKMQEMYEVALTNVKNSYGRSLASVSGFKVVCVVRTSSGTRVEWQWQGKPKSAQWISALLDESEAQGDIEPKVTVGEF